MVKLRELEAAAPEGSFYICNCFVLDWLARDAPWEPCPGCWSERTITYESAKAIAKQL